MNFEKDASGGHGTLTLDGELTVQRSGELKDVLMKARESVGNLFLNLESASGVDIAGLQLLCALHRSSALLNKQVGFTGDMPACVTELVENAGYAKGACCRSDMGGSCLWAIIRGAV